MNKPQSPRLERERIHQAAKEGNLQFWRDKATFEAWKNGGYIGDCPQTMKGTLVDYITDAILALLSPDTTAVSSTDRADRKFANGLSVDEYWKIRDEMTADTPVVTSKDQGDK